MSLPTSCCWLSLRVVSILIGIASAILGTLYMVTVMAVEIVHGQSFYATTDGLYYLLIWMMTVEYTASAHIIFSLFLVYGCIQEVSYCALSWLICESAVFSAGALQVLFWLMSDFWYVPEDVICLTLLGGSMFIVYSHYVTMKKPVAV